MTSKLDLGASFSHIIDSVRIVVNDPAGDIPLTALVVGIFVLLLLFLAVIGYIIYSFSNRGRLNIRIEVPVSQNSREVYIGLLLVVASIIITIIGISFYTGRAEFCLNCHSKTKEAKALASSPHKKIECLQCHQPAGISGVILQKVDYTRWLWVYASTSKVAAKHAYIDDGACLRCHNNVRSTTVKRYSIKVRHKDFLDKGMPCIDCHNTVAHADLIKPKREPSMDSCLKCHNGGIAKADCSTCHEKDIGAPKKAVRDTLKIGIAVAWDFCYRCHEERYCTQCHGVKMPHPPDWVSNAKHAKPAFDNLKVCWRCHDIPGTPLQGSTGVACACHGDMVFHGPWDQWRKNHGSVALGKSLGNGEDGNCYGCHNVKLCDYCHTPGRYKMQGASEESHY